MNDNIFIEVHDNGEGIEEDKLRDVNLMIRMEAAEYRQMRSRYLRGEPKESGTGLQNFNQRIVMFYRKITVSVLKA